MIEVFDGKLDSKLCCKFEMALVDNKVNRGVDRVLCPRWLVEGESGSPPAHHC